MKKVKKIAKDKGDKKVTNKGTSRGNKKGSIESSCGVVQYDDITRVHPVLQKSLGHCLFKVSFLIKDKYEKILSPLNLAPFHSVALIILAEDMGDLKNQNTLGNELGIDKASMVKILDHLEKQKLVERINDPKDRRNKLLKITSKGKLYYNKILKLRTQNEAEYLKDLTPDEVVSLRLIIPKLLNSLISQF